MESPGVATNNNNDNSAPPPFENSKRTPQQGAHLVVVPELDELNLFRLGHDHVGADEAPEHRGGGRPAAVLRHFFVAAAAARARAREREWWAAAPPLPCWAAK